MADTPPTRPPRNFRQVLLAIVVLALGVNLWSLTRAWHSNLRDAFEFRQYQTALTTLFLQKTGLRLDYETPVLGPPWSVPMEFPLYQGIVAKLGSITGLPLEKAGRLTSILAFYASLPAVWLLLKKRLPYSEDRLVVLAVALCSPVFLFYSRTFLIESTALCTSLWFLAAFDRAIDRWKSGWLLLAWIAGGLAAATKITTFVVFCWPALAMAVALAQRLRRSGLSLARAWTQAIGLAAFVASLPLSAGVAWVAYSDHLKSLNPYGKILTSTSLREFNFGTLHQRFTADFWRVIGTQTFHHVITIPALCIVVVGLFRVASTYRRLALVCMGCYFGGFLIFANLYFVHDYYFYASAILLVAALGVVLVGLMRDERVPSFVAIVALLVALASGVYEFSRSYYGFYRRQNPPEPAMAAVIKAAIDPDAVFAGFDLDWDSTLPYCAQRRAIMPFRSHTTNEGFFGQSLSHLKPKTVSAMVVAAPHRTDANFLGTWIEKLEMADNPIATANDVDLYIRRDLLLGAAAKLKTETFSGVSLHLPETIAGVQDFSKDNWPARLYMSKPAPYAGRGEFPIGIDNWDHTQVITMQTPAEMLIRPPAGATEIHVRCGMLPNSYRNGNTTDGVVIEIREERPDGTIPTLFRRALRPLEIPDDRNEVVVDYTQATPFRGTLVFGAYPGPVGSAAFDWVYWRTIEVR